MDCESFEDFVEHFHRGEKALRGDRRVDRRRISPASARGGHQHTGSRRSRRSRRGSTDRSGTRAVRDRRTPDSQKSDRTATFLKDRIFGLHPKASGLLIVYCEKCGTRVVGGAHGEEEPAKGGESVLCAQCQSPSRPGTAGEGGLGGGTRRRQGAAMGKASEGNGPDYGSPLRGGSSALFWKIGGALLAGAGGILLFILGFKAWMPAEPPERTHARTGIVRGDPLEEEILAGNRFADRCREKREAEARRRRLPKEMIERWDEEARAREAEGRFLEALRFWIRRQGEVEGGEVRDPEFGKVAFDAESRGRIQTEIEDLQGRWKRSVEADVRQRVLAARALMVREDFDGARGALKGHPEEWKQFFEEAVR
ncbi:MAG: hypothetical protein ACYTHN_24180, partial [Planctomycetota bacterium]